MYRPLSSIPLPAAALSKLQESGFHYYEDVITPRGIVSEAGNILRQWNLHEPKSWTCLTSAASTRTALDVWQEECTTPRIVTWSKELDTMLGGGLPLGVITEICGAPGAGKTQLSLQLCIAVQIPEILGGVEGEAVFIDTASGFTVKRLREMADACVEHCKALASSRSVPDSEEKLQNFHVKSLLSGVHFVAAHGISQLLASVQLLPQLCLENPKLRLIVIDSIAFPFLCGDSCTTIDRTSYLYRILSDVQNLAAKNKIAVLITNQLTTRLSSIGKETNSDLVPAMGESLGHRVNMRIVVGRVHGERVAAVLLKGHTDHRNLRTASFKITRQGIRD